MSPLIAATAVQESKQNIQRRHEDIKHSSEQHQRAGDGAVCFRGAQDRACGVHQGEHTESTNTDADENADEADLQEAVEEDGTDQCEKEARH